MVSETDEKVLNKTKFFLSKKNLPGHVHTVKGQLHERREYEGHIFHKKKMQFYSHSATLPALL